MGKVDLEKLEEKKINNKTSTQSIQSIKSTKKIHAVDLINIFDEYVKANPNNRHNKYLSFKKTKKLIEPLTGMGWDKVQQHQDEISDWLKKYGNIYTGMGLSDRSIELVWIGLAYCYEFGVMKEIIPNNPFKHFLPKNPRSGSYID